MIVYTKTCNLVNSIMKTKRVNFSLPAVTLERLKASIPQGKRSRYIAEVLDKQLKEKKSLEESIIRDLRENRHVYEETRKDWSALDTEGWPD